MGVVSRQNSSPPQFSINKPVSELRESLCGLLGVGESVDPCSLVGGEWTLMCVLGLNWNTTVCVYWSTLSPSSIIGPVHAHVWLDHIPQYVDISRWT